MRRRLRRGGYGCCHLTTVFTGVVCFCLVEFESVCCRSGGGGGGEGGRSNFGHCCEYAFNARCKSICRKAKSRDDLDGACLVDQDFTVLHCMEKQEVEARCCSTEVSSKCVSACRTVFVKEQALSEADLRRVSNQCPHDVTLCIQNYTKTHQIRNMSDSAFLLPCCDENTAVDGVCRTKCRAALNNLTKEDEVIDEIALHCGTPDPTSALWQCFLRQSTSNRHDAANVVSIRLACCHRASSSQCRNMCVKNYSQKYSTMADEFEEKCLYSPLENDLIICLAEVENRCEPGCSNLKYCSNFNDHPAMSFRSCNLQSDVGAQQTVQLWSSGMIVRPALFNFDIPIKDIGQCESAKWKAIACAMFIKPCHPDSLSGLICRSDCLDVLSKCLDTSRMTQPGITAEIICSKLSPQNSSSPCISLSLYSASRSTKKSNPDEVITPCNPDPCNGSQACVANWKICPPKMEASGECHPFQCIHGCSLGEGVPQAIPLHAFIRTPYPFDTKCYKACQCGYGAVFRRCKQLGCIRDDQCAMPSGMILGHGMTLNRSCTRCVCHSGKLVCTKRFCHATSKSSSTEKVALLKVLPCGCPVAYTPVCGVNGQTYASACLAQCADMKPNDTPEGGSCSDRDPCSGVTCPSNERCLAKRQKCLWFRSRGCKQYECVALRNQCDHHGSPVCDQYGREFQSTCHLLLEKHTLAYRGHCLSFCSSSGMVCGVDGDTYATECAAWANGVLMDYIGHCRSVGNYHYVSAGTPFCPNVSCSDQHLRRCDPIIPPGACCPICAGEIRLLMSESLLESAASYLPHGRLTVADVLDNLRLHVRVLQCEVFGYLNVEGDLTILLKPIVTLPSPLQIEACMAETKRLGYLLGSSNAALTTYLALSVFVSADVRTCRVKPVTATGPRSAKSNHHFLILTIITCLLNWYLRLQSL